MTYNNEINNEIVFDDSSGISIEEQQEILSKINSIAEKNRQTLSVGSVDSAGSANKKVFTGAKKKGVLFPVIVNTAAIVILAAGCLFLLFFNRERDIDIREGNGAFTVTERALIEEIRRDTAAKIAAKEMEIVSISSRLGDIDAQLMLLYSSHEELTAEQLAAQQQLYVMQAEYRMGLAALYDERSQILEDSRSREAQLRAQLEERARESAAAQLRVTAERDSAMIELERLTNEQERAIALDAQLAGGLSAVNNMINNGEFEQAALAVAGLRELNNSGIFAGRQFQARRETYNHAIDSIETMLLHLRRSQGFNVPGFVDTAELQAAESLIAEREIQNRQLEERIAEMQRTIDLSAAGSAGQMQRLAELDEIISDLRTENTSLHISAAEKDRTITSLHASIAENEGRIRALEARNENYIQRLATQDNVIQVRDAEISNLTNRLNTIMELLQD